MRMPYPMLVRHSRLCVRPSSGTEATHAVANPAV